VIECPTNIKGVTANYTITYKFDFTKSPIDHLHEVPFREAFDQTETGYTHTAEDTNLSCIAPKGQSTGPSGQCIAFFLFFM